MKLLADENIDLSVVSRLREAGYQVLAVAEMEPGIPDEAVLGLANKEEAILVTEDKDFGELAFRQFLVHQGVILIRLAGMSKEEKASIISNLINVHGPELPGSFTVVSANLLRIRKRG